MSGKKVIGWALSVILILLIVGTAAGLLVLRSRSFHRYVLAKIVERAQEATGCRVEIGDYTFRWSGLRADVYRVVIHGTEAYLYEPLFKTDHLSIGFKIISSLRRKVDLNEIVIDHPVVRFLVDKEGRTNLPHPPVPKEPSRPVNIFDLAIKHFIVNRGELYYNDQQAPLDAELHDLQTQVEFDIVKTRYLGSLRYRQGRVQFGNFNPLQHDLEARFSAAPSGFSVDRLLATSGPSCISAQANLRDYSNPMVEGTYKAVLAAQQLRYILKEASLPAGEVATSGTVRYRSASNQPFLNRLLVDGQLSSPALALKLPQLSSEMRAIRGRYRLENGNLDAHDMQADVLGGHLGAEFTMRSLANNANARLIASVRAVSLSALNHALRARPAADVPISGRLDGKIETTWHGRLRDLEVRSDATIAATTESPSGKTAGAARRPVPLDGVVHLAYDDARSILSLSQTYLKTPHTELRLNGTVGELSHLDVQASTDDLHELDLLALSLRQAMPSLPARESSPPRLFGLYGSASFQGQIQGPAKNPRLVGQVLANNLEFAGDQVRSLRAGIGLSSSSLFLHHGDLQTTGQGRIQFDATLGLRNWSYARASPVTLQVSVTNIPVGDVDRVASLHYPVTGILSASISVRGSQLNPVGRGSVQLTQARAWNESIQSASLHFQSAGEAVHSTVTVRMPAGSVSGNLVYYPSDEGYAAQMEARNIRLNQLQTVRSRNLEISGVLTAYAKGRGTLRAPQLEATLEVPELQVREQRISGLNAQVSVAHQRATFALDSSVFGANMQARGTVNLTPDYEAALNFDSPSVPLGPLLASYLPGQAADLHGQTELHGWLKGPLKDVTRLQAHVDIPTLSVGYQSIQIANAAPIRVDYRNGVLALDRTELKGTGTGLQLQATIPVRGAASISDSALGTVDLHLIQILYPEWDSSGQVRLNIDAGGNRTHPSVLGEVRIINAAFQAPSAPLGMEKIDGDFALLTDGVEIRNFAAQAGGGTISAQGFLKYQPQVQFNVGLTASSVRLRYPKGVRALLEGDLRLTGTPGSALLNGQVLIDRLFFTQSFDLATFMNQFTGQTAPVPNQGFAQNLKLDVGLRSTEELGLASSKLSLQGSANLRVRGTAAEPVILGRANLTGGELFFLGNRYQVQSSVVDFTNPVRTQPVVNLAVATTVDQYSLNLNFVGPLDRLRTTYTSDPPLPPVDIINLLAFGKTTEAAAASPSTPSRLGAESLLAQGLAGEASSRVEKFAGISHLSIDPLIGGNQTNPGARLAIQQRVTKNLLFTFATDVTSTQGQVVQAEYQISRRWSVSGVRGANGGIAFDVKMHKTF